MTDATREHAHFDELAAGYALHALDPTDEQEFLAHLAQCPRCRDALSDFTEVAAALADDWSSVEPSPQLGERIMAAVADEPRAAVADLDAHRVRQQHRHRGEHQRRGDHQHRGEHQHRRRLVTIASAAAAAVLVAGGATWGAVAASGGGSPHSAVGCAAAGSCRQVVLTDSRTHEPAAKVVVSGGTVWLIPSSLPADDTARQVYVLWQITGAHTPLAVGSFDVRMHGDKPVRIGALAVPYRSTWAFAVSLERGRTIPATPSGPVALGQVSS